MNSLTRFNAREFHIRRPRYVLLAYRYDLQSNGKNNIKVDSSLFVRIS